MDWLYKAMLTAAVVAAVMMAARLAGRVAAGWLAGLPVITMPALLWLAHEQGASFAAASAVGSLAACSAAALFALTFERVSRRRGAAGALGAGLAVLALAAVALQPLDGHPLAALAAAAATSILTARVARREAAQGGWVRPLRGEPWLSAAAAGGIAAGISLLALRLGPYWSGLLATLPIISACALVHLQHAGTPGDVTRFVAGYAPGLLAKTLFLFVFALFAPSQGAPVATLLGLAAGASGVLGLRLWRRLAAWQAAPAGRVR
jgi:hypothetical protein